MKEKNVKALKRFILILMILILAFLAFDIIVRNRVFLNSIASSLYKMNRLDKASSLWNRKMDANDKDPIPEANYAKSEYRQGKYSDAQSHYSQGLQNNPEHSGLLYDQGNALYRQEKLDDALTSYRDAMLADPKDQDAKSNYELVLKRKGYKPPKPEDEKQQNPEPQNQNDYENTLNALDQMEPKNPGEQGANPGNWKGRWW